MTEWRWRIGIALALIILVVINRAELRTLGKGIAANGGHELAYGFVSERPEGTANLVSQFLSLKCLDPSKISFSYFEQGGASGGLGKLGESLRGLKSQDAAIKEAVNFIGDGKRSMSPADCREIVSLLVKANRTLADRGRAEDVLFIHYEVKQPTALSAPERNEMAERIAVVDGPGWSKKFKNGKVGRAQLGGNINIYPWFMENTSWYDLGGRLPAGGKKPVFEVRFLGLKGLCAYLLEKMKGASGKEYYHLDGESI